jgi:hypothetical protein
MRCKNHDAPHLILCQTSVTFVQIFSTVLCSQTPCSCSFHNVRDQLLHNTKQQLIVLLWFYVFYLFKAERYPLLVSTFLEVRAHTLFTFRVY